MAFPRKHERLLVECMLPFLSPSKNFSPSFAYLRLNNIPTSILHRAPQRRLRRAERNPVTVHDDENWGFWPRGPGEKEHRRATGFEQQGLSTREQKTIWLPDTL